MTTDSPKPDSLNEIGVLKRREIEARIIGPLVARLAEEFGEQRVHELTAEVIVDIARTQGAALAEAVGDNGLAAMAGSMSAWTAGGALEIEVLEQTDEKFSFNVTRCRYAELYRELGLAELGASLSCNRDGSLMEGFNPNVEFTRTQTIMSGASHCDFRYRDVTNEPATPDHESME